MKSLYFTSILLKDQLAPPMSDGVGKAAQGRAQILYTQVNYFQNL